MKLRRDCVTLFQRVSFCSAGTFLLDKRIGPLLLVNNLGCSAAAGPLARYQGQGTSKKFQVQIVTA